MANTYTLIQAINVGSGGQASIDFTSIPSTYTDLSLVVSARATSGSAYGTGLKMVFNNVTSAQYTWKNLQGYDSTADSNGTASADVYVTAGQMPTANQTASVFGSNNIYIPNYAGGSNKSISAEAVTEQNATTGWIVNMIAGLWSNTSAINRITLSTGNGSNFVQYSNAYLYGIKNS
jgi:hypothetical protein